MNAVIWLSLAIALLLTLAYQRNRLPVWLVSIAAFIAAFQWFNESFSIWPWLAFAILATPLAHRGLRKRFLSGPAMAWFRSVLPPMSQTERDAIDSGTVWWDGDLFSGRPDWAKLLAFPARKLSAEEQAFLDGPVDELCAMLDDWDISNERHDLPESVWRYLGEKRFFGMIIPKEYGGLEFSAQAQSEVVTRISTRSTSAAVTVMVPNSLGPGELLLKYGTDEQRNHYLPRLADGRDIPAFGLTGPWAGSDAGAMPDRGVACMGEYAGSIVPGFRVTWEKRYITLGPVATVLGLAFKAYDPDGVLGDTESLGITCALIPTDTPGVEIGDRHWTGMAFQNGPNRGRDVFVPMDWIIGGQERVGQGWRMLMECLAVGRSISLPAMGAGAGKLCAMTTGAYARVRKQFRTPIGRFEGVEEALARIGGHAYRMEAARLLTATALDLGEKPSVLSAILKYHNTEGMRQAVNDAMDIHGGRGICMGPSNYLARPYRAIPIGITVEGANILTRSMIIFGQGAIRCHPYVLDEMLAASEPDAPTALNRFDHALFRHIGFTISNAVRALVLGLTGARLARAPATGPTRRYFRQLSRMSAAFALVADVAMLMLGGKLKRREKLSARLGDILSHLYLASAVLKRHEDDDRPAADMAFVAWSVEHSLYEIQTALEGVLANFPSRFVGRLLRLIVLPLGRPYRAPSDRLGSSVARLMLEPSPALDRLLQGTYADVQPDDAVGRVLLARQKVLAAEPVERKIFEALGKHVPAHDCEPALAAALDAGVISDTEAATVRDAARAVTAVIGVDQFPAAVATGHAGTAKAV